jgi:hypothetical protein
MPSKDPKLTRADRIRKRTKRVLKYSGEMIAAYGRLNAATEKLFELSPNEDVAERFDC